MYVTSARCLEVAVKRAVFTFPLKFFAFLKFLDYVCELLQLIEEDKLYIVGKDTFAAKTPARLF